MNRMTDWKRNFSLSKKLVSVGCIDDKTCNINGIEQHNMLEQRNPSMQSHFWNPQTCSRAGTSLKTN